MSRDLPNLQPNHSSTRPSANGKTPTAPAPKVIKPTVTASSTSSGTKQKWVIYMNNTNLTSVQESVLARGSNFALVPRYLPKEAYITAVEEACSQLPSMEAD